MSEFEPVTVCVPWGILGKNPTTGSHAPDIYQKRFTYVITLIFRDEHDFEGLKPSNLILRNLVAPNCGPYSSSNESPRSVTCQLQAATIIP